MKNEMNHNVGKETRGESKVSKVTACVNNLQKARESYNTILEKGKQLGLDCRELEGSPN